MATEQSSGTIKAILIGALSSVLGTVLVIVLGMDSGPGTVVLNTNARPVEEQYVPRREPLERQIPTATTCLTQWGNCPLLVHGPQDTPCYCMTPYGAVTGIAQ